MAATFAPSTAHTFRENARLRARSRATSIRIPYGRISASAAGQAKPGHAAAADIDRCPHIPRWRTFMKKSILLAFLFLAAALAGCSHPNDLIDDDVAAATVPGAQA
jgi:hypothetical protein